MNVLRTDTEDNFLVYIVLESLVVCLSGRKLNIELAASGGLGVLRTELNSVLAVELEKLSRDKVHLRSADEACNEHVARHIVQVLRGIDLLDDTIFHDDDTVAHGHSLGLVVGNVDEGGSQLLVQLDDLGAHGGTQLSVQVGERLVKQQDMRISNDRTADLFTLSQTTR